MYCSRNSSFIQNNSTLHWWRTTSGESSVLRIGHGTFDRQKANERFLKNGCLWRHATCGWQNNRREGVLLDVSHTRSIFILLQRLMSTIDSFEWRLPVWCSVGIKTCTSKNAARWSFDQKPSARMSSRALSRQFVDGGSLSPPNGWSWGSFSTSMHTYPEVLLSNHEPRCAE